MDTEPTAEVVATSVALAGRAPSLHNSQPWRWVFDGTGGLRLYAVPERMLPATDPSGRQLLISCGIALDHLRVAMAAAGWRSIIDRFPNPNRRDQLATIRFEPARVVTDADLDRAAAIRRRHTDRLPFDAPAHFATTESLLRMCFDPADAILDVLSEESRTSLAYASEQTAALRRYDAGYQAELRWWAGNVVGATGVPESALVTAAESRRVPVGRAMPAASGEPRRPEVATDHSVLLLLSTHSDHREDVLRCGTALSAVLLECTLAGYATCPLTHITEYPRSRSIVAGLGTPGGLPQVLIRVGTRPAEANDGEEPPETPRLPLGDILDVTSP